MTAAFGVRFLVFKFSAFGFFRFGVWVLGFTTGEVKGVVAKKINQQLINVFVPTTPNPTSGFLLMVPKNQLKYLNTNVDDAIKTIVSAGIIDLKSKQKSN